LKEAGDDKAQPYQAYLKQSMVFDAGRLDQPFMALQGKCKAGNSPKLVAGEKEANVLQKGGTETALRL
jgi:hypothetical protein